MHLLLFQIHLAPHTKRTLIRGQLLNFQLWEENYVHKDIFHGLKEENCQLKIESESSKAAHIVSTSYSIHSYFYFPFSPFLYPALSLLSFILIHSLSCLIYLSHSVCFFFISVLYLLQVSPSSLYSRKNSLTYSSLPWRPWTCTAVTMYMSGKLTWLDRKKKR